MIVISEEIGTEKPEEANNHRITDKFADHRYCYIADNLRIDFIVPNKLGWRTVGMIDHGLNMHIDTYRYTERLNQPQDYILDFDEIKIVN